MSKTRAQAKQATAPLSKAERIGQAEYLERLAALAGRSWYNRTGVERMPIQRQQRQQDGRAGPAIPRAA